MFGCNIQESNKSIQYVEQVSQDFDEISKKSNRSNEIQNHIDDINLRLQNLGIKDLKENDNPYRAIYDLFEIIQC